MTKRDDEKGRTVGRNPAVPAFAEAIVEMLATNAALHDLEVGEVLTALAVGAFVYTAGVAREGREIEAVEGMRKLFDMVFDANVERLREELKAKAEAAEAGLPEPTVGYGGRG